MSRSASRLRRSVWSSADGWRRTPVGVRSGRRVPVGSVIGLERGVMVNMGELRKVGERVGLDCAQGGASLNNTVHGRLRHPGGGWFPV
jgi:hypothetical protein